CPGGAVFAYQKGRRGRAGATARLARVGPCLATRRGGAGRPPSGSETAPRPGKPGGGGRDPGHYFLVAKQRPAPASRAVAARTAIAAAMQMFLSGVERSIDQLRPVAQRRVATFPRKRSSGRPGAGTIRKDVPTPRDRNP